MDGRPALRRPGQTFLGLLQPEVLSWVLAASVPHPGTCRLACPIADTCLVSCAGFAGQNRPGAVWALVPPGLMAAPALLQALCGVPSLLLNE